MNMNMENKQIKDYLAEAATKIMERAEANKGYEYENYWISVNYAMARGGYMKTIGPRAFGIFVVIRSFMNHKTKIAFPKLKTIHELTGLNVGTVRKDTSLLEKHGWIKRVVEKDNKGKFAVTKYIILQNDLVRGSGDPSFNKKPVTRLING